jgi:hypothetical protein
MIPTRKETSAVPRRLDRERLKALAEASRSWPAYMRAELGVKAPSRIDTRVSCCADPKTR